MKSTILKYLYYKDIWLLKIDLYKLDIRSNIKYKSELDKPLYKK